MLSLPQRRRHNSQRAGSTRSFPGHRAWVRGHGCSVRGCESDSIECAHVRGGTDGAAGLKPSDFWTVSLCTEHHAEQHRLGERSFARRYGLDLLVLAREFARRSPHRWRWSSRLLKK